MRSNSIIKTLFCLTLIFAMGCGQSDEETIAQAMKQMQADQQARSKVAATAADSMSGDRSRTPQAKDNSHAKPVGYRDLQALLPENLSDMNRANAAAGNEDGILLTITDLGGLKGVKAIAEYEWVTTDIDRETASGYERSIMYKGYRGFEKYDHTTRNGEIQILVADRFVVQAQGFQMKMEEIKSALNDVDLEKIASMKRNSTEDNE
jgi:hypothetical protein